MLLITLNPKGITQSNINQPIDSSTLKEFETFLNTLYAQKGDSIITFNSLSQQYRILFYGSGGYTQSRWMYRFKNYYFKSLKKDDRIVTLTFNNAPDSLADPKFLFVVNDGCGFEKITTGDYDHRFFVECSAETMREEFSIKQFNLSDNS
ncbi:MAG: hypothetical protein ACHQFW_01680, partial [Chitinophagales bacterium]